MFLLQAGSSVVRKIAITTVVGALSFPLTNLLFDSVATQLAMAVGVGAVILIIQFLVDFEQRLAAVEESQEVQTTEIRVAVDEGFAKVSAATLLFAQLEAAGLKTETVSQLVTQAAAMGPGMAPLLRTFVQGEMVRMTQFLHALGEQEATYDGEDREWLLGLARSAGRTIDAVSMPTVDAGGTEFERGFWGSELGHRYLALQREAVCRGVHVRRIFVIKRPELAEDPGLLATCRYQADLGIEVRVLYPADITDFTKNYLNDFILFDDAVSYEVVPARPLDEEADPLILYTRLVLRPDKLAERKEQYRQFWASAKPHSALYDHKVGDSPQGRRR
ncbi:phosphatidylserine/phosphatidylglycerophosphate/cardiolipin synthase family protein [Actinocrispum wychmicini]|uniref:Uncharacterized protein n=1 Tax=Actinocrispum wychmicini TaxID=1213861 RepID=A0A4R2ISV8_9PSEU|nr:phosphatidylserine/phosphatidylglycerophosphate/cardiolipin synthase family protein [Actinocrispum wychmicini]TCO47269.1 hypothetical protein EV192_1179 [Actinocrispum wychmicini]